MVLAPIIVWIVAGYLVLIVFRGVTNFVRLAGLGGSSWEDGGQFDLEAVAIFGLYRFKSFDPDVEFP